MTSLDRTPQTALDRLLERLNRPSTTVPGSSDETPRTRLGFLFLGFCAVAAILVARLYQWQVIEHDRLVEAAQGEHFLERKIEPRRGAIYDRNGYLLATTVTRESVMIAPREIDEPDLVADKLAPVLGLPKDDVYVKIKEQKEQGAYLFPLKRKIEPEIAARVAQMNLDGVYLQEELSRVYPGGTSGAQMIGFADIENRGQYGVEGFYNETLYGQAGLLQGERDTVGDPIMVGNLVLDNPTDGSDVTLTIDRVAQYVAEQELERAIKEQKAESGSVVILDPKDGSVLAMAIYPSYDPAKYQTTEKSLYVNPIVSSLYEPGSVIKVLTMAAGLDSGTVTPDTVFYDPGYMIVQGGVVHPWDMQAHGWQNMRQVMAISNNVGAAFVSTSMGPDLFYKYFDRYGVNVPTGIDLQGEASLDFRRPGRDLWQPIDLATNSFGQGLSMTPLHVAVSIGSVANRGVMMKPHVLASTTARDGKVTPYEPAAIRRTVSEKAALTMTEMLVDAVAKETTLAQIPGYTVAGKTGTAQIPIPTGYDPDNTIASFIGYVPAYNPAFIILVKVDKPKASPWGSVVAAPVFQRIAQRLLYHYGIPPDAPQQEAVKK